MFYAVGVVFILFAGAGLYYVFPALWLKYVATRSLKNQASKRKVLFITFDDGPGDALTAQLLKLFRTFNSKATFFVSGNRAETCPEILRLINKEHNIGSHGYDHLNHLKVSPWKAIGDIKKGWGAIDNILEVTRGVYPFRPPYGRLNGISLVYLWLKRAPIIYWTLEGGDSWKILPNIDYIFKQFSDDPYQVILMHDHRRSADYALRDRFTLALTEQILKHAQRTGVRLDTFK
jgi:peptidoglycan/xylan/chitin deacetylase (PgdA/CDA1 family)